MKKNKVFLHINASWSSCRVYLHCKTTRLQWTRREVIKIKLMECCYSWVSRGLMTWPGLTLTLNVQKYHKISKQKTFNFQDLNQTKECCCRAPGASSADTLGKHMHLLLTQVSVLFIHWKTGKHLLKECLLVSRTPLKPRHEPSHSLTWFLFFLNYDRNSGTTLLASDCRCKHKEEVRWAVG